MKKRDATEFERRVYEALCLVPRGQVTTYGRLAAFLGCGSSQAVGQALRRNPFAPEVPCHRVIRGDLTPGGFGGRQGGRALQRKLALLAEEGVVFTGRRLADPKRVYSF